MIVRGFIVYDRTWVYCIWSYVGLLYMIVRGFIVYNRTWVYCIWSYVGLESFGDLNISMIRVH